MLQKRIHKKRASAFYELLCKKDDATTITFCFDLQQLQVLPKKPIQQAYYARQIGFYNLCISDQYAKSAHFCTWTEEEAGRGSEEISSSTINFFENNLNVCFAIGVEV